MSTKRSRRPRIMHINEYRQVVALETKADAIECRQTTGSQSPLDSRTPTEPLYSSVDDAGRQESLELGAAVHEYGFLVVLTLSVGATGG